MILHGNQDSDADLVVLYGNCQVPFLAQLLAAADASRGYLCVLNHGPVGQPLERPSVAQMQRCVLYLEQFDSQVSELLESPHSEALQKIIQERVLLCRFLRDSQSSHSRSFVFPSFIMTGLWPFTSVSSPRNVPEPGYVWGRYPYGNALAEEIVASGLRGSAAVAAYYDRLAERLPAPAAMLQTVRDKLFARDVSCDVKIADYVWETFQTQPIFMTYGHVRSDAIQELALRLLAVIAPVVGGGDDAAQQRVRDAAEGLPKMGPFEEPIDPQTAQALGLTFYHPEMRFHWCGQDWTFDEYINRYLAYDTSW